MTVACRDALSMRDQVLSDEPERFGLHAEIRDLRHEDHRPWGHRGADGERRAENAVVGRVGEAGDVAAALGVADHHADRAQPGSEWAAARGENVAGERVEPPEKLPGLEVDVFIGGSGGP